MPVKNAAKHEERENDRPNQSQAETERYLLQIDRQSKRSFKTPEAARSAGLGIKGRFPTLQVSIYDNVTSTTLADLFTPLRRVDPSAAVRTSPRARSHDEIDDGVSDGRQRRLRWRSVDSFFSRLTFVSRRCWRNA